MLRASSSFESKMSAIITLVAPVIVIVIVIVLLLLFCCVVIALFVYRAQKTLFAVCPVHALLFVVRFLWRLASFV